MAKYSKILPHLLMAVMAMLLWACSDDNTFTIQGTVDGGRTMNLRIIYTGEDVTNNVLTASRDGKFAFKGHAPEGGALVRVTDNDFRPLATVFVHNGDKISMTIDATNPYGYTATGNDITERLGQFVTANAKTLALRTPKTTNALIANYVKGHRDDMVSTILLVTEYFVGNDPVGAGKLLETIARPARPDLLTAEWIASNRHTGGEQVRAKVLPIRYLDRGDTVKTFDPKKAHVNLLVFTNIESGRRDSIIDALRTLNERRAKGRFAMLDFSMDTDTINWSRNARTDSVKWPTAWAVGSIAAPGVDRLGIPSLPYFIVADSTGRQVYRGSSLTRARAVIDSLRP